MGQEMTIIPRIIVKFMRDLIIFKIMITNHLEEYLQLNLKQPIKIINVLIIILLPDKL